ncbi:MAG: YicC/YloC family endoribonuclease, partial [Burkholderiaceae bacterium]
MTGFGTAECVEMGWHFAVDIRSVNGRFLDFSLRCPEEIRQIEAWLREQVNAATQRGKLEMRIQVRHQHAPPEALQINEKLMANLLSLVSDIKEELQDVAAVSPLDLLQFPGMILDASHVDQDFLQEMVKRLTPIALRSRAESREAEGERLASFLRQRLNGIRDLCTTLEAQ